MYKPFLFLAVFTFLILMDYLFLGILAKDFFDQELRPFARAFRLPAALAVWALLALGLLIFVLPLSVSGRWAMIYGALFGFIVYGVFDLTNFAVFRDYSLMMVMADVAWGSALCCMANSLLYYLSRLSISAPMMPGA